MRGELQRAHPRATRARRGAARVLRGSLRLASLGSLCLLALGCPGQRRPPPGLGAASSPTLSATPGVAPPTPTPTPTPTPRTLPERIAAWKASAEALLGEKLSAKDLDRLQALADQGGVLNDRALEAELEDELDAITDLLTRLGERRYELVDAAGGK